MAAKNAVCLKRPGHDGQARQALRQCGSRKKNGPGEQTAIGRAVLIGTNDPEHGGAANAAGCGRDGAFSLEAVRLRAQHPFRDRLRAVAFGNAERAAEIQARKSRLNPLGGWGGGAGAARGRPLDRKGGRARTGRVSALSKGRARGGRLHGTGDQVRTRIFDVRAARQDRQEVVLHGKPSGQLGSSCYLYSRARQPRARGSRGAGRAEFPRPGQDRNADGTSGKC